MSLVFIDTQIYLDGYRKEGLSRFGDALRALEMIGDALLVTEVVRNEVERGRLGIYVGNNSARLKIQAETGIAMERYYKQASGKDPHIDVRLRQVRSLQNELQQAIRDINRELERRDEKNRESIVTGTDAISRILDGLFDRAVRADWDQIERALFRQATQRPPGKRKDSSALGDEVSWEQILDRAKTSGDLWLVSRDGDFHDRIGARFFLKPSLMRELREANPGIVVHLFQELPQFLAAWKDAHPDDAGSLPSRSDLAELQAEIDGLPRDADDDMGLDPDGLPSDPSSDTFDALLEEYMSGAMHLARARHIMEAADPVNTLPAPEPAVRTIVKDEEEFTEQQQ